MKKAIFLTLASFIFLSGTALAALNTNESLASSIKRLTYSGNNVVLYPCLSEDGRRMAYVLEIRDGTEPKKSIRLMDVDSGKEKELFGDDKLKGLGAFQNVSLKVGSKPPVISGSGGVVAFCLSLGEPANILDHYLAVASADGSKIWVTPFPIEALADRDLKSLEFASGDWERVSDYALSSNGTRIACVVKGHLGPRRYGNPSAIVFLDVPAQKQRTILAPEFSQKGWTWPAFPCRPLIGGGWAFGLSGDGQRVVFGAQSSEDKNDYDLYIVDWEGKETKRITDFHDRWFSLADISVDGETIVFFYNGKTRQGIGTYRVSPKSGEIHHLQSRTAPLIELFDMTPDGRFLFFKHIYKGMRFDLGTGQEIIAFDDKTPGYVPGNVPMDFPRIPAFWGPEIASFDGDRILLVGLPQGRQTPEIYLLTVHKK